MDVAIILEAECLLEAPKQHGRVLGRIRGLRPCYVDILRQGALGGGITDPDDFRVMPWGGQAGVRSPCRCHCPGWGGTDRRGSPAQWGIIWWLSPQGRLQPESAIVPGTCSEVPGKRSTWVARPGGAMAVLEPLRVWSSCRVSWSRDRDASVFGFGGVWLTRLH